jgi:hypothetical protein
MPTFIVSVQREARVVTVLEINAPDEATAKRLASEEIENSEPEAIQWEIDETLSEKDIIDAIEEMKPAAA